MIELKTYNPKQKFLIQIIITTMLLLLAIGCSRVKQLEITGHIGGNNIWTKDKSPYLLSGGDVYLDQGGTLTIEPGVTVNLIGNNYLIVEGKLDAQGTESEPIIFKPLSLNIGNIRGLKIVGKDPSIVSVLKYIQVHDANFGIYLDGANAQISYSLVSGNGEGIHLWNSNALVEENRIINNQKVGIYCGAGKPTIHRNIIAHNQTGVAVDYDSQPIFTENDIDPTQNALVTITRSATPLSLANNWWGTTNINSVKSGILPQEGNVANLYIQLEPIAQQAFHK